VVLALGRRGSPLLSTPSGFTEVFPTTWASDDLTGTAPIEEMTTTIGIYPMTKFTTTTDASGVTAVVPMTAGVPMATEAPATNVSTSGSTHHLGLAIALPFSLLVAGLLIALLYLHRHRARRAAQRRRNSWASRMAGAWIPDVKGHTYTDEPSSPVPDFHAHPMSTIAPVPRSHQRKDSIV